MKSANELLAQQYLEMRNRTLSLAADFDRLQRAPGGQELLRSDPKLRGLQACLREVLTAEPGRAERVQMALSDVTPPPSR